MAGGLALAVALAGCGGGGSAAPPATTATAPSVVHSAHRSVTIAELRASIDRLYRDHSGIGSFTARDVSYTPATRDKVLSVCQKGGPETDPNTLEAAKLAGCAPLVFFFYRYGRRAAVPDSIEIARNIYWYAADNVRGPFDARNALNVLLQRWGIP